MTYRVHPTAGGASASFAMLPVNTPTADDFGTFEKAIEKLLRLPSAEARVLNGWTSWCKAFYCHMPLSGNTRFATARAEQTLLFFQDSTAACNLGTLTITWSWQGRKLVHFFSVLAAAALQRHVSYFHHRSRRREYR